jgi:hypothetical protein
MSPPEHSLTLTKSVRIAVLRIPDLGENLRFPTQQGQGGECPALNRVPPAGRDIAIRRAVQRGSCYSLNATPLNAATPGALDVATWVKSP